MHPPHHIYGIDFSGGKDKGKKIWTSKGIIKGEYSVRIAARLKGIRYRVEPHLPPDVLGIYVYLPVVYGNI